MNYPAFIHGLLTEAQHAVRTHKIPPVQTLYLGGGTPSLLPEAFLSQLVEGLRKTFDLSSLREATIEANPTGLTLKKSHHLRALGFTRVSLGVQSFDPTVLQTLGRHHTPAEALQAIEHLRAATFPSINLDLMFSVPGQTLTSWNDTLKIALAANPDHLSCYNLTYEEDTDFFKKQQQGQFRQSQDTNAEHYHLAESLLTASGFRHYETSNYAQPGHQSLHNQGYWHGHDYLGIGPSSVSTINATRWKNIPDTSRYLSAIRQQGHARTDEETITPAVYRLERLALLLRTDTGLPRELLTDSDPHQIEMLLDENLAHFTPTHLILTKKGRPLVDPIATALA